jgi:hypothetical protein
MFADEPFIPRFQLLNGGEVSHLFFLLLWTAEQIKLMDKNRERKFSWIWWLLTGLILKAMDVPVRIPSNKGFL